MAEPCHWCRDRRALAVDPGRPLGLVARRAVAVRPTVVEDRWHLMHLLGARLAHRACSVAISASFIAPGIGTGTDLPMVRPSSDGVCHTGDRRAVLSVLSALSAPANPRGVEGRTVRPLRAGTVASTRDPTWPPTSSNKGRVRCRGPGEAPRDRGGGPSSIPVRSTPGAGSPGARHSPADDWHRWLRPDRTG